MCGIAGIFNPDGRPVDPGVLRAVTRIQAHRGPDDEGYYERDGVGLGQRRLSIIDLSGGKQPIHNEDKTVWTVFNGEIFNYIELQEMLVKKGHRFYTHSDTEVIVHLYEEYGLDFVDHLNGQFGIAIWDETKGRLVLARDRVGIRPVFYSQRPDGALVFGSEMKALFRYPGFAPEIDPHGLAQIYTFWVNVPPRTVFRGVQELGPGRMLIADRGGNVKVRQYWRHEFPGAKDYEDKPISHYIEKLREILHDSTTLQLRADVTVATYLSGGLDSSIISALVKKFHNRDLITFSVAFKDKAFDESGYQKQMVDYLGTDHRMMEVDYADIGRDFEKVVWYAERPMIRTAPAPLYALAGLVRKNGVKVVLTGEGSDEIFGGYNIFREDKLRRFWARDPSSKMRPALLSRLYPYINKNAGAQAFWRMFFRKGMEDTSNPYYSHLIRWNNTSWIKGLFEQSFQARMPGEEELFADLDAYMDPGMDRWHPLCRAQYLEMVLFMSGYLLSSQGDRMMMGQSIEGRFPFLDHRLIEFAATIPPKYKLRILDEKHILKRAYTDLVPKEIVDRPKQPYRAPIYKCFLDPKANLAASLLTRDSVETMGYFQPDAIAKLLEKAGSAEKGPSEREDMALVGVASLHLLHHHFLSPGGALAKGA